MFDNPVLNKKLKTAKILWNRKLFTIKHPGDIYYKISRKGGRNSPAYQVWRNAVLKRDGFKCVNCGSTKRLQAHHKKMYFSHKKKRFNIDNGLTLCFGCHKKIHPWMGKIK